MKKYLYGASVQGIQSFIFETGKLKEIIGASEIVESICTSFFKDVVNEFGIFHDNQLILGAAGNIKYIFANEDECRNVFRVFECKVRSIAPGITISQAVIPITDSIKTANQQLEIALRAKRNIQTIMPSPGWMISERARKTGLPATKFKDEKTKEFLSLGQHLKREKQDGSNTLLEKLNIDRSKDHYDAKDMQNLLLKTRPGWLAVIHADGNGLGKKLMALAEKIDEHHYVNAFRTVSRNLDNATKEAAQKAYAHIVSMFNLKKLVIRPVILGGDDLTAIMDGSCAFEFTEKFLEEFQIASKNAFKSFKDDFGSDAFEDGLTACAGIAYIKPKFPIHYGVELSEMLCKQAKKVSKTIARSNPKNHIPASLLFHKIHASHVIDYNNLVDTELTASSCRFDYGPYFLEVLDGFSNTKQLKEWVKHLSRDDSPASGLRNWLTTLKLDAAKADQQLERIREIHPQSMQALQLDRDNVMIKRNLITKEGFKGDNYQVTHLYDVLSLASINVNSYDDQLSD